MANPVGHSEASQIWKIEKKRSILDIWVGWEYVLANYFGDLNAWGAVVGKLGDVFQVSKEAYFYRFPDKDLQQDLILLLS